MQYVALSLVLSLVLSALEAVSEDITLIPTLGLGSLALDGLFLAAAEYISRQFEKRADAHGIPHIKGRTRNAVAVGIINILPGVTFIRFGLENLVPAVTGKIKVNQ